MSLAVRGLKPDHVGFRWIAMENDISFISWVNLTGRTILMIANVKVVFKSQDVTRPDPAGILFKRHLI
jgi:hypothetical protein